MDVTGIGRVSTSIAETGTKRDVDLEVQRRAQQIQSSTATQLIEAIQSVPSQPNLPAHLGNNVNTTA